MPDAVLEVEDLSVTYGSVAAVRNVSLRVLPHAIVSVLGMNGAGKSSLLWALSGTVRAASGTVRMAGKDISRLPADARAQLGLALVPETGRLFKQMTVYENLKLAHQVGKRRGNDEAAFDRVYGHFPILQERSRQLAGQLSGGEAQQLAIARSLMLKPEILLLDEPSFGLAPLVIDEVFTELSALRDEGVTILLVEQNAVKAMPLSDYCYVLSEGEVQFSGSRADLENRHTLVETYLGEGVSA